MQGVRRWYFVVLLALFLGWIPKAKSTTVPWFADNDFAHSYLTALMVREGTSPYDRDLLPLYREHHFFPTRDIVKAGNPPPLAVVMVPLTWLSPEVGFRAWGLVQLLSLLGGVFLLIQSARVAVSPLGGLALMIGAIAPLSTFALVRYGQSQGIIFFLIALGVWWAQRGNRVIAPFLFGVASSFKLFTLPLVVVALRYFGMRGVLLFSAGFVVLWIPFVFLCGGEGLVVFFTKTLPYVRDLSLLFDGNISLSGAVVYSLQSFDVSAHGGAPFIQGACVLLLAAFVGYDYRRSQKEPQLLASVSFVLVLCVILSPTSWPHYAPLLLCSFVFLVKAAQVDADATRSLLKVLGIYLCMGCALGYQRSGDLLTQVVSAWWAPVWMGLAAWMVDRRRGSASKL